VRQKPKKKKGKAHVGKTLVKREGVCRKMKFMFPDLNSTITEMFL
jgi:hypothetical protein